MLLYPIHKNIFAQLAAFVCSLKANTKTQNCSAHSTESTAEHYERGDLQVVCRFINRWKSDSNDKTFKRLIELVRSTGEVAD